MYSRPTAPKSIGGVLDDIFKLFAAALPKCWPISLVSSLLVMVPTVYLNIQMRGGRAAEMLAMVRSPVFWITYLLIAVISITCSIALMIRVTNVADNEDGSFGAAITRALQLLPRTFLASILYVLCIAVGFVLLIIPGLILTVSMMLSAPIIVIEDAGALDSLTRSRNLVKGDWWRTSAIFTVALIVVYLLLFCVQFAAGFIAAITAVDPLMLNVVVTIISGLSNIVMLPLYASVVLSIYFDLKLRKEGGDLAERVAALAKA